ncbi:GTP-binding protein [Tumidithrix elongata RA019]|uniref:GTP-binding protein n=1 Tax=Tumidithrix elongata BACA0141 TaxID=2716417 RepID=A0AAW9PT54_9CYAN|nr:GTP-binding protein [Tumidithrix elongata RA019]
MLNSRAFLYLGLGTVVVLATGNAIATVVNDWQAISAAIFLVGGALLFFNLRRSLGDRVHSEPETIDRPGLQKQLQHVKQTIAKISDLSSRQDLMQRAEHIASNLEKNQFRIVVFGTGSAGKTSVINALLGKTSKDSGKTAATIGTTQTAQTYVYDAERNSDRDAVQKSKHMRQISLVDTPGIQEMGLSGRGRELEATRLAHAADLLIFVTAGDLTAVEYQQFKYLVGLGKRVILAFNKTDCYLPTDLALVEAKLAERTTGFLSAQDIVAIAAQPNPIKVRQYDTLASTSPNAQPVKEWLETLPPDIAALKERIEQILSSEWEQLLLKNTHLQIQALKREAQLALQKLQRTEAEKVLTRYQVIVATTTFANPLPALDLVASAAINTQLLIEISRIYDRPFNLKQAQQTASIIAQSLLQLGCVELATTAIATCLKTNAVTYAIGGSVQAIASAYLTHIGGQSFITYLEQQPHLPIGSSPMKNTLHEFCQNTFRSTQGDYFFTNFVSNILKDQLHISAFKG